MIRTCFQQSKVPISVLLALATWISLGSSYTKPRVILQSTDTCNGRSASYVQLASADSTVSSKRAYGGWWTLMTSIHPRSVFALVRVRVRNR